MTAICPVVPEHLVVNVVAQPLQTMYRHWLPESRSTHHGISWDLKRSPVT